MKQRPVDQFNQTFGGTRKWFGIGLLLPSVLGFTTIILTANRALKNGIDTHTVNALRYSMTIILATIMLGERLSSVQWIGAGLVVVGIILIAGRFKKGNN